jgi:uncharacterized protein (DUF1697 family)
VPTYVAFLRAINLGATRKFPKEAIRACAESLGFDDVATYINTGNVRLRTPLRSRAKVESALEAAFRDDRGFDVPVIAFRTDELVAVARNAAELGAGHPDLDRQYVLLLKQAPASDVVGALHALDHPAHRVEVRDRAAHVLIGPGRALGDVDPLRVERRLGVVLTSRNATVVDALAGLWC